MQARSANNASGLSRCRFSTPPRWHGRNSSAVGSAPVLTDFGGFAGSAQWDDVNADALLFGGDGWLNEASAASLRAVVQEDDAIPPKMVEVSSSSGSGGKPITWPTGIGHPVIYVAVNPTASGTYVGSIPNGSLIGQRAILSNVGTSLSFDVTT